MTTSSYHAGWSVAATATLGAVLAFSACGGDGDPDGASEETPAGPDDSTTSTGAPAQDGVVEVELTDFAFDGLPDSAPAGTRLTITNSAELELHKLSALPIADDEERPLDELIALRGAELAEILRVRPATVLVAAPGGPQIDEVGDGTLSEPGRYAIICSIPLGADPNEYLDALPSPMAPQVSGEGPPHFRLGMVAELVVE